MALGPLNLTILFVYLGCMIAIGWRLSSRQKTTEDFFLAGRSMPWLAVGMSMFASVTSAVTFMGLPGRAYSENISLIVVCLVSPLLVPFLTRLFYPFYQRLRVTTSYEYIDRRFGRKARYCASGLFVLARLGWMGTVVFAPALALSVATGLPMWGTILMMGVLATTYTVLGGLSAVIWTDVAQFVIMVVGAAWVACTLVVGVPGGVGGIVAVAREHGHLHIASLRPSLYEMSALVVAFTFFFQMMQDYGTDQVTVQRLMAVKGRRGIFKAILFNAGTDFFVIGLLLFIGIGLFAFYQHNPAMLAEGIEGDKVLPFYIVSRLPVGVSGLLLAAIFAAAMSSMDSGINSLATVVTTDFVRNLRGGAVDETRDVRLARLLTLGFGALATAMAFAVSRMEHIIQAYTSVISLFSAPVLALFLMGMLTVRGRFPAWLIGCAVSIPASLWLQRGTEVHWVYYFPFSFLLCFGVGYLASLPMKGPECDRSLTVWGGNTAATME
jgi:SSS family solute:Na+ symporter